MGIEQKHRKRRKTFDTIIVGNLSVDKNIWPRGQIENALGGAPTYSGSTFTSLGRKIGIFSTVGRDHFSDVLCFFRSKGIDTAGLLVSKRQTMIFQNSYDQDGTRKQKCLNHASELFLKDMPKNYMDSESFYISPLAGEVDEKLLKGLRRKGSILMLDPQGLMRIIGKKGDVDIIPDKDMLKRIFRLVDIVKIGKDELDAFDMDEKEIFDMLEKTGVKIAIITKGKEPVTISHRGRLFEIQTLSVEVEDPTGAGDVFGAAFLSEYMTGFDVKEAAKFAATAAGLKIKYKGPSGFPSKEDIVKHLTLN